MEAMTVRIREIAVGAETITASVTAISKEWIKGQPVAQIEAQCMEQGCALRLRATDAGKAGTDSLWMSVQSEPFGLVVELSESALLKASPQD